MKTPNILRAWLLLMTLVSLGITPWAHASDQPAPSAIAGHVAFVNGDVQLLNTGKQNRTVQTGDPVYVGDQIQTLANAHLHLRMIDNAFVALRPESQLTIRLYDYDKDQPQASRIRIDLQQGTSRAVTGKGGQAAKHQYRFNTPLAAIGLRGTDYTVTAEADKTRVSVTQGGVIVSPFGADCLSAQLGPCKTPFSRELTAEMRNSIIEVTPNQAPRLLSQPSASLAPSSKTDTLRNPSETPPTEGAWQHAIDRVATAVTQPVKQQLVAQTETSAQAAQPTPAAKDPSLNQAEAPAAAKDNTNIAAAQTPQAETVRPDPLARWGRWSSLVKQVPEGSGAISQVFGQINDPQIVATNQAFALAHPLKADTSIPAQGRVQFGLIASEAYVQNNGQSRVATVQTGQLEMDFGQKTFKTQVAVLTGPSALETINAQGQVDNYGRMQSAASQSNANVKGIVLSKGTEATYLFEKNTSTGAILSGATQWAR